MKLLTTTSTESVSVSNNLMTELGSIEGDAASYEESVDDNDVTTFRTPTKPQGNRSCSSDEETHALSPWGSFREESGSMSSSSGSSWGTGVYSDMRFSMISNATFFVGACIQTYTTIVDLKWAKEAALTDDDVWDDDSPCVNTLFDWAWYSLYSLGPLLYIVNSLIDILWMANEVSPWSWSFWCRFLRRNRSPSLVETQNSEQQEQYQRIVEVNLEDNNSLSDESSCSTMDSSIGSAYRSELAWQFIAAFVFGLGAIFEFYSTFLDDYYSEIDDYDDDSYLIKMENKREWYVSNYRMDFVGMHLYLLSGVIMLYAQRNSYRSGFRFGCCFGDIRRSCFGDKDDGSQDNSERPDSTNPTESSNQFAQLLMFLGTLLFVFGTILDCSIAYFSDPAMRHGIDPNNEDVGNLNQVKLTICDLISSVMWNIDAILYICADILLYSLHKKGSKGRKWLCKKRGHCSCAEEVDEDVEDYDRSLPGMPELERQNSMKPLLQSFSISTYSTL